MQRIRSILIHHSRLLMTIGIIPALLGVVWWRYGRDWLTDFYRERVQTALVRSDFHAAEQWLTRLTPASTSDGEAALLRLRFLRKMGSTSDFLSLSRELSARPDLKERVLLESQFLAAAHGDTGELEKVLPVLLVNGNEPAEVCEAFVLGCLMNYRLNDAENILTVWLADFPDDPRAHFLMGRLLQHRENMPGAVVEYRKAVESGSGPAAYSLAGALIDQQEFREAMRYAEFASQHLYDPQPGSVLMARIHRNLNQLSNARQCLLQAEKSDQKSARIAWRLAGEPLEDAATNVSIEFAELELAEKHYFESEARFRDVLKQNPLRWRVRHSLATALRLQGKLKEASAEAGRYQETMQALARCDKLIDRLRSQPDDTAARYEVGATLLDYVSEKQGLIWLQGVLLYDPRHQAAHRRLADYYRQHSADNPSFAELARQHEAQLQTSEK